MDGAPNSVLISDAVRYGAGWGVALDGCDQLACEMRAQFVIGVTAEPLAQILF